jgi:hypothetical protein
MSWPLHHFGTAGFTEAGDAELTDAEVRAQGRHKSAKVLPRYAIRTMRRVAKGIIRDGILRGSQCQPGMLC